VHASALVGYYLYVAMGKPGARLGEDEDTGEVIATYDDEGIPPSEERRDAAVKWLADRGHGLPAQMIHLNEHLKTQITLVGSALDVSALPAGSMRAILDVINARTIASARDANPAQLAPGAPLPGALASVIDVGEVPSTGGMLPAQPTPIDQQDPRASSGSLDPETALDPDE
jgi:hypothetical protein